MADTDLPLFAAPGNEDVPATPAAVADQGLFAAPGNNQPAGPRTDSQADLGEFAAPGNFSVPDADRGTYGG